MMKSDPRGSMPRKLYETIRVFAKGVSEKDIWTYAASSTFFLFLSLFPILILLSLLLPFTGIDAETLIGNVTAVTPGFIDDLVEQIIRETYDHANGLVLANAVFQAIGTDRLVIPMPIALVLHFRYLILLAFCVLFLTLLYTTVSGAKRKLRLHLPGAALASITMSVFTWGFSVYIGYNQNYATIYGSFTAFVVMLLWAYACIYIVLVCGRINRILSAG
ncbi:MAG: YihY/virulence factor BrkB family protein [Lachnospiraceae bacterium]|nr:YihY/virulence factor BrkB family protein [Lachnospiraceae bacterium]